MKEAQDGRARLRRMAFEDPDPVDFGLLGLPEVERDERHAPALAREQAHEDALLHLGAADDAQARVAGEYRPGVRRHEADVPFGRQRAGGALPGHARG
jgi:hypothetical protein